MSIYAASSGTTKRVSILNLAVVAAGLLGLTVCSDSATPDDILVGRYTATFWTVTKGDEVTDALVAGATLGLTLASDGRTSGELHLPPSLSKTGAEQTLPLDGEWERDPDGSHVHFIGQAGTFLPDATWTAGTTTVAGSVSDASGSMVKVILGRRTSSDD